MRVRRGLYRAAMLLLPPDFRRAHDADLLEAFDAQIADARARGPLATTSASARSLLDLLARAPHEHIRRIGRPKPPRPDMTLLDRLLQDLRLAWRVLRRAPAFTIIVTLTLGLGIGATTAVFSVVNRVLLTPLPYRHPERLVKLWESEPGMSQIMISYPDFLDWRTRTRVFDGLALYSPFRSMSLTGGELPERVGVGLATSNLFDVVGVRPVLGRTLRPDDDQAGAARVAMLSNGWWKRHFAGDPRVLGKSLMLNGDVYTVVGVLPPLIGLGNLDLWITIGPYAQQFRDGFSRQNHPGLIGVGRLKPGVSLQQMRDDLARVSRDLAAAYPADDVGMGAGGDSFRELLVQGIRPALRIFAGAVFLVLLIACVNVANLVLARGTARDKEMALRLAIGADQRRLVWLLLVESLLLAFLGGAAGVALAYGGLRVLVALKPLGIPRLTEIGIDGWALACAAGIVLLTGVAFGLLPARRARHLDLNHTLKEGGRAGSAGRGALRVRGFLMVGEVRWRSCCWSVPGSCCAASPSWCAWIPG